MLLTSTVLGKAKPFANQKYRHTFHLMAVHCHCKMLDQFISQQVKILVSFQNIFLFLFILILKCHLKLVAKPADILGWQLKV
jgi:hypothetical protein